ncbi:hypothetical protein K439DRAFT_1630748, partial [Ramaria rubella]
MGYAVLSLVVSCTPESVLRAYALALAHGIQAVLFSEDKDSRLEQWTGVGYCTLVVDGQYGHGAARQFDLPRTHDSGRNIVFTEGTGVARIISAST